jgi:hypothetical protein
MLKLLLYISLFLGLGFANHGALRGSPVEGVAENSRLLSDLGVMQAGGSFATSCGSPCGLHLMCNAKTPSMVFLWSEGEKIPERESKESPIKHKKQRATQISEYILRENNGTRQFTVNYKVDENARTVLTPSLKINKPILKVEIKDFKKNSEGKCCSGYTATINGEVRKTSSVSVLFLIPVGSITSNHVDSFSMDVSCSCGESNNEK